MKAVCLKFICFVAIWTMNLYAKFDAFNALHGELMPKPAKSTSFGVVDTYCSYLVLSLSATV